MHYNNSHLSLSVSPGNGGAVNPILAADFKPTFTLVVWPLVAMRKRISLMYNTHTKAKQSVSLRLAVMHLFWDSRNAYALGGPLSQYNVLSWSLARNSQVD